MTISFTKAHGAMNDFLLTWDEDAPREGRASLARAICSRHSGVGADGWLLVSRAGEPGCDAAIHLFNSDGSEAEISGNGTRCAAAFLLHEGLSRSDIRIRTGAGLKSLRLIEHSGLSFTFEMNMGRAEIREREAEVLSRRAVILWVGNPQCAIPVDSFEFDWRAAGARIESDPRFPNRTNVSFLRRVDEHTIDVRFWERGAGETMSSGTGATGAAAAAAALGMSRSPIRVLTPAGPLDLRLDGEILLTGPAAIIAQGEFLVP